MRKRVDLLAHLHRAKLGGVGAAGAARHHDGHEQHADFARDQNADHVDHIVLGAELAEVEEALLRDDAADEEGNQDDDRRGLPADPVELMDRRGEAEVLRVADDPQQGQADGSQHVQKRKRTVDERDDAIGVTFEGAGEPVSPGFLDLLPVDIVDIAQEPLVLVAQACDLGVQASAQSVADQAFEKPGAVSVECSDIVHVDGNVAYRRRLLRRQPDHRFKIARVNGRPRPRSRQLVSVPLQLEI